MEQFFKSLFYLLDSNQGRSLIIFFTVRQFRWMAFDKASITAFRSRVLVSCECLIAGCMQGDLISSFGVLLKLKAIFLCVYVHKFVIICLYVTFECAPCVPQFPRFKIFLIFYRFIILISVKRWNYSLKCSIKMYHCPVYDRYTRNTFFMRNIFLIRVRGYQLSFVLTGRMETFEILSIICHAISWCKPHANYKVTQMPCVLTAIEHNRG